MNSPPALHALLQLLFLRKTTASVFSPNQVSCSPTPPFMLPCIITVFRPFLSPSGPLLVLHKGRCDDSSYRLIFFRAIRAFFFLFTLRPKNFSFPIENRAPVVLAVFSGFVSRLSGPDFLGSNPAAGILANSPTFFPTCRVSKPPLSFTFSFNCI